MTFNTKSHFKTSLLEPMHRLYGTMAFLAFDVAVDVSLMVKQDMFCHQIDLFPRRGRLRIEISMFFPYPWVIRDNIIMTMKALFHRGKPRKIRIRNIGMTIETIYFFYTRMHLMAKGYGLLRANIHLPVCIEKIHECCNEKSRASCPK